MRAPKRHRKRGDSIEDVLENLPDELRSFDDWYFPDGLRAYATAASEWLDQKTGRTSPDNRMGFAVMSSAGLDFGSWYRHMMTSG